MTRRVPALRLAQLATTATAALAAQQVDYNLPVRCWCAAGDAPRTSEKPLSGPRWPEAHLRRCW